MDIKKEPDNDVSFSNAQDNFFEVGLENNIENLTYERYSLCSQKDDRKEYDQKNCMIVKKEDCFNFQDNNMKETENIFSHIKIEHFDNVDSSVVETLQDQDLPMVSQKIKTEEDIQSENRSENVEKYAYPIKIEKSDVSGCSYPEFIPEQVSPTLKNGPQINDPETPPYAIEVEIEVDKKDIKKELKNTEPVAVIILNKVLFHKRNFVCSHCFDIFTSFQSLSIHKTVHSELKLVSSHVKHKKGMKFLNSEKNFKCDYCDFRSARLFDMKQHIMTHTSEKPFKCDFCDFKSSRSFSLKNHIMRHKGEKPFNCEKCSFKTARSHDLKRHTIMSHSIENSNRISRLGNKPFKCGSCDFTSSRSFSLKRHKLVHSGEKPLNCDRCDFTTARMHDLKRHISSHTGDRPFVCDFCDYKSARSYDLKRHKLLHNEMNPI